MFRNRFIKKPISKITKRNSMQSYQNVFTKDLCNCTVRRGYDTFEESSCSSSIMRSLLFLDNLLLAIV